MLLSRTLGRDRGEQRGFGAQAVVIGSAAMKNDLLFACLVPIAISCGGGEKPPEIPTTTTPSASASTEPSASASASASAAPSASGSVAPPPAALVWKDMNHEQKLAHMKTKVMPKMSEEFAAFDDKKYAGFGCKTCHGDSAKDGSYKMPNPKLPKLPTDPAGFKALMAKKPDAMKFMGGKVKPDMAGLLSEEQFEPEKTPQGFGCYNCHEKATK
jgi:hypothetical protein